MFGTNNSYKIRACTVLNILSRECNFEISGLRYGIKLQHTSNDPDPYNVGPD